MICGSQGAALTSQPRVRVGLSPQSETSPETALVPCCLCCSFRGRPRTRLSLWLTVWSRCRPEGIWCSSPRNVVGAPHLLSRGPEGTRRSCWQRTSVMSNGWHFLAAWLGECTRYCNCNVVQRCDGAELGMAARCSGTQRHKLAASRDGMTERGFWC